MRVVPPPESTILPPPSMIVSLSTGAASTLVSVIVCSAPPQENVTTPPACTAARNAASVQPEGSPLPTTVVGELVSMSSTGAVHWLAGSGGTPPSQANAASPTG